MRAQNLLPFLSCGQNSTSSTQRTSWCSLGGTVGGTEGWTSEGLRKKLADQRYSRIPIRVYRILLKNEGNIEEKIVEKGRVLEENTKGR